MKIKDVIVTEMGAASQKPAAAPAPAAPPATTAKPMTQDEYNKIIQDLTKAKMNAMEKFPDQVPAYDQAIQQVAINYKKQLDAANPQAALSPEAQRAISQNPKGQSAQPQAGKKKGTAKFDPAVQARQKELIAAGAKIKADGFMGPKTREAEKQFGAQIDTAKAQAQQGQPGPTTVTNPAQATQTPAPETPDAMAGADATAAQTQTSNYTGQDIRTANARDTGGEDPARLQQLAGMNQTSNYTGQDIRTANARGDVPTNTSSYQGPQSNALGVQAQVPGGFGQPTPAPDQPRDQAAQPAQPAQPAKDPTVAPDVKTGTGGTLTTRDGKAVKSRSDDEIAWANANPANRYNPNGYPGPGNWDPRTGRSLKDIEQGQKNLDRVKNFFGFGKKEQPAAPAAPAQSGQAAQPGQGQQPGGYGKFSEESEILRKLAGLK